MYLCLYLRLYFLADDPRYWRGSPGSSWVWTHTSHSHCPSPWGAVDNGQCWILVHICARWWILMDVCAHCWILVDVCAHWWILLDIRAGNLFKIDCWASGKREQLSLINWWLRRFIHLHCGAYENRYKRANLSDLGLSSRCDVSRGIESYCLLPPGYSCPDQVTKSYFSSNRHENTSVLDIGVDSAKIEFCLYFKACMLVTKSSTKTHSKWILEGDTWKANNLDKEYQH